MTGAVRTPGVFEVELGTPVAEILARAGADGPTCPACWSAATAGRGSAPTGWPPRFAPGPLAAAGATLGVGIVVALPASSCGIAETARIARYMAGESAGQCGPCVFGLPAIADDLEHAVGRAGADAVLDRDRAAGRRRGRAAAPAGIPTGWSAWSAAPWRCSPRTPGPTPRVARAPATPPPTVLPFPAAPAAPAGRTS